jgi:hypothetical protein
MVVYATLRTHALLITPHPFMKTRFSAALFLATAAAAVATPTGLNNIPTADTPVQGDYVFQTYSTLGGDGKGTLFEGFKTGFDLKPFKLEIGADSQLYPGAFGPATAQAKLAYALGQGLPTIAVGAANITFTTPNRHRAGDVFAYSVVTEDLGFFRIHAGCADQAYQALPFFGIDKTFKIPVKRKTTDGKSTVGKGDGKEVTDAKSAPETEYRDILMLRADAIQQQNHTWLSSAGVLVPVCKYFVLETWGNFPSDGSRCSVTVKGDFVVHF